VQEGIEIFYQGIGSPTGPLRHNSRISIQSGYAEHVIKKTNLHHLRPHSTPRRPPPVPAHKMAADASGVTVSTAGDTIRAARVVLALPPRLAAGLGAAVTAVPTRIAVQAKLVATYPAAFWRAERLNGDAISHGGPLAETHEASPADAGTGALFGFSHPGAVRQPGVFETLRLPSWDGCLARAGRRPTAWSSRTGARTRPRPPSLTKTRLQGILPIARCSRPSG
jgi:hypothetical protein